MLSLVQQFVFLYIALLVLALAALAFYHHLANLHWEERERREMEQARLNLAHLLQIMEAADYRSIVRTPRARRYLFLRYSQRLHEDVVKLIKVRRLGPRALLYALLFLAAYRIIRLKARLLCSPKDLRFLSGIELGLVRSSGVVS